MGHGGATGEFGADCRGFVHIALLCFTLAFYCLLRRALNRATGWMHGWMMKGAGPRMMLQF